MAWTFESEENRTAMWNTTKKEAQKIKEAVVSYGKAKYAEFQEADLQGKARIITGIGAETVLVAVPAAKLSKLGNISKAEKALNAANQLDNIADATKSLTAIERIKNTTNILATKTKEAFQYTKTIIANENGYVRLGGLSKAEESINTIDRIRNVAQKSFDYAVRNPRKQGLNRMQLGKDAEVQATRWLKKWAEKNNVNLGKGGLQFQVRGANSIPDVLFEPTKNILDFKLSPKAIRKVQSNNFTNDFPGYSIEYIFGPKLGR